MTIYGIRHHGPGCARSLVDALTDNPPDVILLESPVEAEPLLADAELDGMEPPLAALIYEVAQPQNAAFYPFARFSPEWQAILWALRHEVPIRCLDLAAAHSLALEQEDEPEPNQDPFHYFARADGYGDGERWWNDKVEERTDSTAFFAAILEAVTALRSELGIAESRRTLVREAWMRRTMRRAEKEGFENIAVVCGAWHAPALVSKPIVSADNALLKGLVKVKVAATWAPWTYERLTAASGYGAGVRSPGWYDHLWSRTRHPFTTWMTRAARILRKHDLEGSSASIIEAARLSESLAGLRGRPRPGLDESLEAIQTIFCAGDPSPLTLLHKPLLIGTKLGTLPQGVSRLPLQLDIEASQKRLRLKPAAEVKQLTIDLREENGRRRSAFLHRLLAVQIGWGTKQSVRTKGTFKENWKLSWKPELTLAIIDASRFGNTLQTAATTALISATPETSIAEITEKLDLALLSDLHRAVTDLVTMLDQSAATSHDTFELLTAVPALARIARYGDVRKTDTGSVLRILSQLTARIHVTLPSSAAGLDETAAADFTRRLRAYTEALGTLQDDAIEGGYHETLTSLARSPSTAPEPRGYATRVLRDMAKIDADESATLFSFALSPGIDPGKAAAWLEGFLAGSGSLLVHDTPLIALIDAWIATLSDEQFQKVLPLVRRTFGSFSSPERSRISQVIQKGNLTIKRQVVSTDQEIDVERALPALATVTQLLDLPPPTR